MNDLQFWRSLRNPTTIPNDLVEQLTQLAKRSAKERLPFFGWMADLLHHPEKEIRKGAVRCLRMASSSYGLRQIIPMLYDPEPDVRLATVEVLRETIRNYEGERWAHVLFHPDVTIRKAGLEGPPPCIEAWNLYLLADPHCRDILLQKYAQHEFQADALELVLRFVEQKTISAEIARPWIGWIHWTYLLDVLRNPARTQQEAIQLLELFDHPDGQSLMQKESGKDDIERFLALYIPSTDTKWFDKLADSLATMGLEQKRRTAAALAVAFLPTLQAGPWLEILAALWPWVLRCSWLPMELRRLAAQGLYRFVEEYEKWNDADVIAILQSDFCRQADGLLNLNIVGAILHLFQGNPYQKLLNLFPATLIRDSFHANPEMSVPFFRVPEPSGKGRTFLIRELGLPSKMIQSHLLAQLCRVIPVDGYDFLDSLDGAAALELSKELLFIQKDLNDKKIYKLAQELARKMAAGYIAPFLQHWLPTPSPEEQVFGVTLLGQFARGSLARLLDQAIPSLNVELLYHLLDVITIYAAFPYDRELAIAEILANHADERIRNWATVRVQRTTPQTKHVDRELLLKAGVCFHLRSLPDPIVPDVETCAALLASHDLLEEVDQQFVRFAATEEAFIKRLDSLMIEHWRGEMRLPLQGHVWLFRWDDHAAELDRRLAESSHGLMGFLQASVSRKSAALRRRFWESITRILQLKRTWKPAEYQALWSQPFIDLLVDSLPQDIGFIAAEWLQKRHQEIPHDPVWKELRFRIVQKLVSCAEPIRECFASWIPIADLPAPQLPKLPQATSEPVTEDDASEPFSQQLLSDQEYIVYKATVQLLQQPETGLPILFDRFRNPKRIPGLERLVQTIFQNPYPDIFSWLEACFLNNVLSPEIRFRIGKEFIHLGERAVWEDILNILQEPSEDTWFTEQDWNWLSTILGPRVGERNLYLEMVRSCHVHAYGSAIHALAVLTEPNPLQIQTLQEFLDLGTVRPNEIRVKAAENLLALGASPKPIHLLLQQIEAEPPHPNLLVGESIEVVLACIRSLLLSGYGEPSEFMCQFLLLEDGVHPFAKEEGLTLLLQQAESESVRREVRNQIRPRFARGMKLRRVADTFAWGIRVGRQLTRRLFSIEMISGEQLGYTRFSENKIYINPLPILRGEMNGREVVRALILHEYGHHMYHRGEEPEAIWKQSDQEGLQRLLNLVSDEHLERNLRALDRRFGDQLKQLGAYAFQHTAREIPVTQLLSALGTRAFEVLSTCTLSAARNTACVGVLNGRILTAMEKAGLSFARFVRALRMGLGNRHEDPKVEEALNLFKGKFRKSSMAKLYEITKELRRIFGKECDILNTFDQDAILGACSGEPSEDIENAELQAEIRRSLEERSGRAFRPPQHAKGGKGLNLSPDEHFDLINNIEPKMHDPARHGSYAQQVQRPAQVLREFLKQLGIGLRQQRFRLSGKTLDKTRLRSLILRGDPRLLIARELQVQTDLFIGVVIDCSGSMDYNSNIEKAKLFGTLIAESAKGYPGVDVRLFGFTDTTIYDAGTGNRCAVHDLEAGGGNNDAAGLWHAALAAKASRRKAKLLVMISDGAPTECSVSALRALVVRLTKRMRICCAQVGVCPLEHICFPHYILLDQDNVQQSVRQFGRVMAKLVQTTLRG